MILGLSTHLLFQRSAQSEEDAHRAASSSTQEGHDVTEVEPSKRGVSSANDIQNPDSVKCSSTRQDAKAAKEIRNSDLKEVSESS